VNYREPHNNPLIAPSKETDRDKQYPAAHSSKAPTLISAPDRFPSFSAIQQTKLVFDDRLIYNGNAGLVLLVGRSVAQPSNAATPLFKAT
jgi:hypothetical protein